MLLETSRCMPQNEQKEMTKLGDARHAAQKQWGSLPQKTLISSRSL